MGGTGCFHIPCAAIAGPDDRVLPSFFRGLALEYRSVVADPAPTAERVGRGVRHTTDVVMTGLGILLTGGRVGPVGTSTRVIATAGSAQNIMNGVRLSEQLTLAEASSVFTTGGRLSQQAINGATEIIPAGALGNPAIPAGFAKFTTETFKSPGGPFQVHFYMNPVTREVFYGLDYKVIFNTGF